jgi:ribonuclease R
LSIHRSNIQKVLEEAAGPLGVKEILRLAGLHPGQQTELKRLLREWLRSGGLLHTGKRYHLAQHPGRGKPRPPPAPRPGREGPRGTQAVARRGGRELEGTLHVHPDGFGFVHPREETEGENIYLPPEQARRALDRDLVRVSVSRGKDGRLSGEILSVVDRRRQLVVGTYRAAAGQAWVEPHDGALPGPIAVPPTQMAQSGDLVKVRLGVGTGLLGGARGLVGEVAGSLGAPGSTGAEVLSLAFAAGFSDEFPPEVMDQADGYALELSAGDLEGRRDLRAMALVTVDGEDARDFDDAIYVEPAGANHRLVVAIADVSHYVRERTPLDVEALRRATSVYLPDRVLPMLPERLSNGICSLRPDGDRLCMVADMVLDRAGKLVRSELYPAVMRSHARCTYNEVQAVLDGKDVPHRNAFKPHFERMQALARVLRKMREGRGAIDFDLPEVKVELGPDGLPVRMVQRERIEAHRIVEECMLAANEAVARYFQEKRLPSVYRFHGSPDEEKLASFATLAAAHGFQMDPGSVTSAELNAFVQGLAGHPEQRALNQLLLRSMMQAVYSAYEVGHYGLAAEHYLHFTSPIRRYPDLLVHRLLKAHWAAGSKKLSAQAHEDAEDRLDAMAQQSSERERAAMQVERDVVSFYAALLMKDRVGETFAATVASLTERGFFVQLEKELVEGMVRADSLGPMARLDTAVHALVFPNGRKIRVGQKLTVRLASVNTVRRQMDFEAVAFAGEADLPPALPRQERKGRGGVRGESARKGTFKPVGSGRRDEGRKPRHAPFERRNGRPEPRRPEPNGIKAESVQPPDPPRERIVTPGRSRRWEEDRPESVAPRAQPEEPPASSSPHPGFDRLRALAAKQGLLRTSKQEPRGEGRDRDGKGRRPGGKHRR